MIGIIPAAGKGLRFKELGRQYNKCVLPYKEKPLLVHQIDYLRSSGCDKIIIVVNHRIDTIEDILDFYKIDNVNIVIQNDINGLSGAIYDAIKDINYSEDYLIHLGDILITEKKEFKNTCSISVKTVDDYARWCMVEVVGDKVSNFYDKPTEKPNTNLAVSGLYYITKDIPLKELLKKQLIDVSSKIAGEYQFSTVLNEIAEQYSLSVFTIDIIDFGTIEEFLKNRAIKQCRKFNNIDENIPGILTKSATGQYGKKLINELNWFVNLPSDIKLHCPQIFNSDLYSENISYSMEKLKYTTLRDIFLFIDKTDETWENIFARVFELLDKMENYRQDDSDFKKYIFNKTKNRIELIDIDVNQRIINNFMLRFEHTLNAIYPKTGCLMHGDFCFSNLFYDFQFEKIYMIDPRGDLFGSHYYELAKLFHSVLCNYDIIDSELYIVNSYNNDIKLYDNGVNNIRKIFIENIEKRYSRGELNLVWAITASLFLSMIPLHNHNKTNQRLFYNEFLKIYKEQLKWN